MEVAHLVVTHAVLGGLDVALVVVAVVALNAHRFERLRTRFGGAEVSFEQFESARTTAFDATEEARDALSTADGATALIEQWADGVARLAEYVDRADVDEELAREAVFRFVNTVLRDVTGWIGDESEIFRASLWLYSERADGLRVVTGGDVKDAETLGKVFARGEGLMGQVFEDRRVLNVADASLQGGWIDVTGRPPVYRGLLCIPIEVSGVTAGVLSIDRERAERFDEGSVRLGKAAAALIRYALATGRARTLLNLAPGERRELADPKSGGAALPAAPEPETRR